MGTVTQYNLANVRDSLGGGNPVYMSNYYRGGPYVPANRSVLVTEGPYYQQSYAEFAYRSGTSSLFWFFSYSTDVAGEITSYTLGAYTYYRGAYVGVTGSFFKTYHYQISRQSWSTTAINTGVPSSGTLYLSQLNGAANP